MVTIGLGVLRDSIQTDILRPDLFGGIVVNKGGFDKFVADAEDLSLGFLRYPGGTIAEKGWVVDGTVSLSHGRIDFADLKGDRADLAYDLTHPELFAPELLKGEDAPAGLSQLFALAAAQGSDVGIIVPVARYMAGVDFADPKARAAAIAQFKADLKVFLGRLESGAYGDHPDAVLLEIGNEVYGHPVEYAFLARAALAVIGRTEIPGLELGVALQMGRGSADYAALEGRGYFEKFLDGEGHWTLPGLKDGPDLPETYAERITFIDRLMQGLLGDRIEDVSSLRHHVLGFDEDVSTSGAIYQQREAIFDLWRDAVRAAGGPEPEYYASAWTVDSSNTTQELFSAAAAGNVLALIREFLETGVDRAALWGIMGASGYFPHAVPIPIATLSEMEGMAPHAALFALMAARLPDSFAIEIRTSSGAVDAYAFADAARTVIYLDTRDAGPGGIALDLSSFGSYRAVRVTTVGAEGGASAGFAEVRARTLAPDGTKLVLPKVAAHSVIEIVLEDRNAFWLGPGRAEILHDMGEIVGRDLKPGMVVDLLDLSDYRDEHIIGSLYDDRLLGGIRGDRLTGRDGDDVIWGRDGADVLRGDRGRDVLKGGDGDDRLSGGRGVDRLFGDAGSDRLFGGGGADRMWGGTGGDLLMGGAGGDVLRGEDGSDRLFGGAHRDVLYGGAGRDRLVGGAGDDVLHGGAGADTFVFAPRCGTDRIRDFDAAAGDVLDLRTLGLSPGDLELTAFWGGTRLEAGSVTIELMDVTPHDLADAAPWLL